MVLTQERAEARGKVIQKKTIRYDFNISFQKGDNYSGYAELTFSLTVIPNELPIDFSGKTINRVLINGQPTEIKIEDGFILLDITKLKVGINNVCVHYACMYDNDGQGCVSFIDVDKKQYIYTQFESYFANRVLPCFDQPDLKAIMKLNVITPEDWKKVISNETATVEKALNNQEYLENAKATYPQELSTYLEGKTGKMTLFPDTKLLPTYLYGIIAGEYLEFKLENTYKNIPMSVYSIESLFQHLKELAPFIFEITIESMKFFEQFFGYEFSFNKYDQVFAHQYKWGAMENAGVVTFNDIYVWKEKVSTQRMLALANTISHQLAHHWFGNLVTMKWWDDLWLNQSFADFISHFCLEKIRTRCKTINYQSSMASFLQRKGWGYHEDQMVTTHAIRGPVINTSVAESIFDGITYSKGAATMKQLLFLMTEENFSKALSSYFHKYEWSNATIDDFLGEMQKQFAIAEFTIAEWRKMWLDVPSHNIIEAQWDPEDKSPNAQLKISMTPYTPEHPTLRWHRIKVGLFSENCQVDVIEVLLKPEGETIAHYDGSKGYKGVLLNFEDHTFVKNNIDQISMWFFMEHINNIKDVLSRTLVWRSFFDMIKDGKMRSDQLVEVVVNMLAKEPSDSIFQKQFDFLSAAINTYTPIHLRPNLNATIFNFIYKLLPSIPPEQQNRIVVLKSKLPNFAHSDEHKKVLLNWKDGKDENLKDHKMSVGQKWSAVVKAFTLKDLSLQEKEAIFQAQRAEDPSDTAKNKRFTCDALKTTEEEFEKMYEEFKNPDSKYSITVKECMAAGWNHSHHSNRLAKYVDRYFEDVEKVSEALPGEHFEVFYVSLSPIGDDLAHYIERLEKIKFAEGKEKHSRQVKKMVDQFKRRQQTYLLYGGQQAAAL